MNLVNTPEMETPASPEETAMAKEELFGSDSESESEWYVSMDNSASADISVSYGVLELPYAWKRKLRMTHEISAWHNNEPNGKFTYITRATSARNHMWGESIRAVYVAKENIFLSDSKASLLVCNEYIGDSFGSSTWYKLSHSNKIETLRLHPYDFEQDKAQFE